MRVRLFVLLSGLIVAPAAAQFGVGADLGFKTQHVWRGQTQSGGWAFQPSVFGYYSHKHITATGGVWTHAEPSDIDIGEDVGFRETWFGESRAWFDLTLTIPSWLGPLQSRIGWAGYFLDNDDAVGPALQRTNTSELYIDVRLQRPRLAPHVTLWYDVDAAKGAYLETGLQYRLPGWTQVLLPFGSLILNGTAAFSLGQQENDSAGEIGYFQNRGLTHIDVSTATTIGYIPISATNNAIHLELHVQYNLDPNLTESSVFDDDKDRWTVWGGITWTILWPRCRPDREICPH